MQLDREAQPASQREVGNLFKWDLRKLSAFKFEHSKGKAQVRCFCIASDFLRSCAAPLCSIRISQRFSLPVVFVSKEAQKHLKMNAVIEKVSTAEDSDDDKNVKDTKSDD